MRLPVYMDYNATTPVDARVLEAMMPALTDQFGNTSSNHSFGREASRIVDEARARVATLIGAARPEEIIFTSGATESDNLAIRGAAEMHADRGKHIITSLAEHKAVIETCQHLQRMGWSVTWLRPDEYGMIHPEQVAQAITDQTVLVSVMLANNEVGTISPLAEIAKITRERGVLLHTDATQAVGKYPVDVEAMDVDLLSLSAHKLYGPKGVGALYVRRRPRARIARQMDGGEHERGLRSGTLNVPGIVGLGKACELAAGELDSEIPRLTAMRDRLQKGIQDKLEAVTLNGHPTQRLCTTLNLSFAYVEGESVTMRSRRLAVSTGSACMSTSLAPSHVLEAMGVDEALCHSSIRFSLGRFSTDEEVDVAIEDITAAVQGLREMSPLYDMAKQGIDLDSVKWTGH